MRLSSRIAQDILITAIILVVVISLASGMYWWANVQLNLFTDQKLEAKAELFSYLLKEGIVESPSVIILVESKAEFYSKLEELNANTIYYEETATKLSFYVFGYEDNMLVAYRYTISAWT